MKTLLLSFLFLFIAAFSSSAQSTKSETKPIFIGSDQSDLSAEERLAHYIGMNLPYPTEAMQNGQDGTVWIQFTVDTLGKVVNDSVLFENYPILIENSRDFFYQTSGKWKAPLIDGRKVESKITVPFAYRLRDGGMTSEEAYFQKGLRYFKKEKYRKSALYFRYALMRDPYQADYLYNTAVSYLKLYEMDSACYYLRRLPDNEDLQSAYAKFCDPPPPPRGESSNNNDSKNRIDVEVMPFFQGARSHKESDNLVYQYITEAAKKSDYEHRGIVYLRFKVDTLGKTTELEILKRDHDSLIPLAKEIIKSMPRWTPGTQDGKAVEVQYTVPIMFK